jgi:hypothetical protein
MKLINLIHAYVNFVPVWETIICFGFFTILLLAMLIYSKLHWLLKAGVTVSSVIVYILLYLSLTNAFGWPMRGRIPDKFQILWVEVHEPNDIMGEPGSLRYWMRSLGQERGLHAPRVYERPYSVPGHKQAQKVVEKIKEGQTVIGRRNGSDDADDDGEEGDGQGGEGKKGSQSAGKSGKAGPRHDRNVDDDDQDGIEIIEGSIELPSKDQFDPPMGTRYNDD